MLFWIVVAILTAAVAATLIFPLMRQAKEAQRSREGELAVYRDQMKELDRDRRFGLIGDEEAEYARAEIGRRLLAAAGKDEDVGAASAARGNRLAAGFVVVLLPAVGLCLYILMGSPGLSSQPLEARLANPGNNIALMVAKAEQHLARNPNDGAGWDLLAPIYFRSMRLGDAELAYRHAIRLLGVSPERLSGLGETLVTVNDGIVTEDARSAFEESVRLQPDNPRARYYVGLALEQAGRADEARAYFEALAKDSPPDAPWLALVNEHIARNGGGAAQTGAAQAGSAQAGLGNPTEEDIAAAEEMSASDRQDMIHGMVESLDAKLQENPNDFDGWMRLVRSYVVLKQEDKARQALQSGLKAFPPEGQEGQQLLALAQELGLPVEGTTQ